MCLHFYNFYSFPVYKPLKVDLSTLNSHTQSRLKDTAADIFIIINRSHEKLLVVTNKQT